MNPPGCDLVDLPGTTPMPLISIGITVAALAEAMQVHAANEPADRVREPWDEQNAEYRAYAKTATASLPAAICELGLWLCAG